MHNRKENLLSFAVIAILVIVLSYVFYAGTKPDSVFNTITFEEETTPTLAGADKLGIKDLALGEGQAAESGDRVQIHYLGTLMDGTKFDSSYDRGRPFEFVLGARQVIPGFDQGVLGMKIGGKREIIIPPSLGYGERVVGSIPANSILKFIVELISVTPSPPIQ